MPDDFLKQEREQGFGLPAASASSSDAQAPARGAAKRIAVRGKFLFLGDDKFLVTGVTYGTFAPDESGRQFPAEATVAADFASMAAAGANTVRVYTVPPRWLLDLAERHGLLVMVGLPWEQHVCFLDDARLTRRIIDNCRAAALELRGHPALLAYAIGNEIPGAIVRWHGKPAIERFLHRLYRVVKACDPGSLVTYVNYPTTEYLELPFVDFMSFNVYLEDETRQRAYLKRLHNLIDDRPLLLAEAGLDSLRNGESKQAEVLDWQIRSSFEEGCAGICVFSWTDQWYRGGYEITDWGFGLTTAGRDPKPALAAVRAAFEAAPFGGVTDWPSICVVVCSYNGARTIRDTLDGLARLAYPEYEVIVIDDGSTDGTASIAAQYPFRLISTENRGLSAARNLGWETATAEIIAYIDDDAYPDPDWLSFLALAYRDSSLQAVGGPNLAPDGDGWKAECVACAPGGPVHVLLSDSLAEHIPGCNMSFRRSALRTVGGFDARFRSAGDDVDICWRVQQEVGGIGFCAAALVWHHRRDSIATYWRQQRGYGHAEALLEQKWPEKYNSAGHLSWRGRIYGNGTPLPLPRARRRLYHGVWGSAPFQSVYEPGVNLLQSLPLMPEWFLLIAFGLALGMVGFAWPPLAWALPPVALMLLATLAQAMVNARRATRARNIRFASRQYWTVVVLHLGQPLARLGGRIANGLHPWRRHAPTFPGSPFGRRLALWREQWQPAPESLDIVRRSLAEGGWTARCGDEFSAWDLELQPSVMARVRCRLGVEEHGGGRQQLNFAIEPGFEPIAGIITLLLAVLAAAAVTAQAGIAAAILGGMALLSLLLAASGCAHGVAAFRRAIGRLEDDA